MRVKMIVAISRWENCVNKERIQTIVHVDHAVAAKYQQVCIVFFPTTSMRLHWECPDIPQHCSVGGRNARNLVA